MPGLAEVQLNARRLGIPVPTRITRRGLPDRRYAAGRVYFTALAAAPPRPFLQQIAPAVEQRMNRPGRLMAPPPPPPRRPAAPIITTTTRIRNIDVTVTFEVEFQISDTVYRRTFNIHYVGPETGLQGAINAQAIAFADTINLATINNIRIIATTEQQTGRNREYDYATNRMRNPTPKSITNVWKNALTIKGPFKENCVVDHLRKLYPSISRLKKDPIGHLASDGGVTTDELTSFCTQYGIGSRAYRIDGTLLSKTPSVSHKLKTLNYIHYDNHIYPVTNKYLSKPAKATSFVIETQSEIVSQFTACVDQYIVPSEIKIRNGFISQFRNDDVLHVVNAQYEDCMKIAREYGIEDKLSPTVKLTHMLDLIVKFHYERMTNIDSFGLFDVSHAGTWYNKPTDQPTQTIDKNKAYSCCLKNLPFLLSTDMRTHSISKTDKTIVPNALYIATPDIPHILMPSSGVYDGEHLLFCKGKFSFNVVEKMECDAKSNIYKDVIVDLYRRFGLDSDLAKSVVNRAIGIFETPLTVHRAYSATLIQNDEPADKILEVDGFSFGVKDITNVSIYNRKPIAIQIKTRMARMIYQEMVDRNIKPCNVVQINVDSLTFTAPVRVPPSKTKTLDGWSNSDYKPKQGSCFDVDKPCPSFLTPIPNENELITGPAGNGKSHLIRNSVKGNYIILSPKHRAITQHRLNNLNANVIQAYGWGHAPPTEQHIYLEEIGLFAKEHWDLVIKMFLLGKRIYAYGDFDQLLPVGEEKPISKQFLNWMFKNQSTLNANWRNKFTQEYYTSLQTGTPAYLRAELLRHSTRTPEEAELVIAHRNVTIDKYNEMIANGRTIDDDVPVICTTNDLRDHDIYNGFLFRSHEIRHLPHKHFKLAYARTLYSVQGDEVKSFYVAPEDIDHILRLRGGVYTLISRLRVS